jgi:hypothetical protein
LKQVKIDNGWGCFYRSWELWGASSPYTPSGLAVGELGAFDVRFTPESGHCAILFDHFVGPRKLRGRYARVERFPALRAAQPVAALSTKWQISH